MYLHLRFLQGVPDRASRQRLVMAAYTVALLWVLQARDSGPGSDRWACMGAWEEERFYACEV